MRLYTECPNSECSNSEDGATIFKCNACHKYFCEYCADPSVADAFIITAVFMGPHHDCPHCGAGDYEEHGEIHDCGNSSDDEEDADEEE